MWAPGNIIKEAPLQDHSSFAHRTLHAADRTMPESRKTNTELISENRRLRATVAQLEDRLDHLAEHGAAAKALKASETLHCNVMSVVSDVVMIADDAGRLTYVSPNAHFIFGHTQAEILKQGRINLVLPGTLFDSDVLEQRGEIANIECQIRDAVGRARNLLVNVRRLESQDGTVMYAFRDVTERLKIELDNELLSYTMETRVEERTRALREGRDRFRRMVEGLRDEYLFYSTDVDGIVTYVSPSVHTILGYTPKELIGQNWRKYVDTSHELYPELERLEQMRFSGLLTPVFRAPVLHANGEVRLLEFRDAPVRDADGRVIASEGIGKDITERLAQDEALRRANDRLEQHVQERTAELTAMNEELRESTDRYQSVVDDQLEFIVRWRSDGKRNFVNKSYCRYCNASHDDLVGGSFLSAIVEEDREVLKRTLADVAMNDPVVTHEHRVVTPDGRTVWERWTHRALFNQEGQLVEYQSVGTDVTEKRRKERQTQELNVAKAKLATLTDREHDVMRLVVAGDANKVIARKLNLSIKTIEKHRSSLMKKLQVRSVPELVRTAMLIDESSEV
jgi:PAS domain S-box-containing protein